MVVLRAMNSRPLNCTRLMVSNDILKKALSSRSAHTWLTKLGWNWKEVGKAVYKDGHKRPDVCHDH